ncbi:hypothetical protein BIU82_13980 [Arthrobacter sp. SW1]|uniref:UvrD-helicase domain-containing protein n=1 Tax=Arthrobacter sp. SW1 TaxID=1920889 RepID=UPI000877D9E8|nr:ATP-dependent helicase [Arthrobacter sp. SW1]OFI39436.1 hypothetical protein BIU82_13980 [Arthrobacter sp. SW1]
MSDADRELRPSRQARLQSQWKPTGVEDLEPAAWAALRHDGCTAVTAGPGAGKTEFLAQRAAYLLQTETCPNPRRILAISFKRDSAANLARRVASRVPEHADRFVSMTFDAFAKGLFDRFAALLPTPWLVSPRTYDIRFWTSREVQVFLDDCLADAPDDLRREISGLDPWKFLAEVVGTYSLPADPGTPPVTAAEYAAWTWWRARYLDTQSPAVDFVMINRLAELTVRNSPALQRAIRATYPFVFIDEFQDTTGAQLSFLKALFCCPGVTVTAVGDRKQRIMGFAGAVEEAMQRYETDFQAKKFSLLWNFRSSSALVSAQRTIASSLDPNAEPVTSMAKVEEGHDPIEIWTFNDEKHQSEHIAAWIAQDIRASGRTAEDFVLVARQKVGELEPALIAEFSKHEITLRNDDTQYGGMRLQDLLKHDLTHFLLGVLRLSIQNAGLVAEWTETLALLRRLIGNDQDERSARTASDHLGQFTSAFAQWIRNTPMTSANASDLVRRMTAIVGETSLSRFVRGMHSGDEVQLFLEAFTKRLEFAIDNAPDWDDLVGAFRSDDAVSLMTIHRSKGLEYHTVFVLGLDDEQWWSIARNKEEALATFFVGFSRAGHRLVFTSFERSQKRKVQELYGYLTQGGAKVTNWQQPRC